MIARILALGLMSAAAAATQAATPPSDVPTVRVGYADLDLSTEHGALTLYRRIEVAARQVCPTESLLDLRAARAAAQCMADAISRAVADVNNPQLAKVGAMRARRLARAG